MSGTNESPASPLIKYGVDDDGELHMAVAKEIWEVLQQAASSGHGAAAEAGYVKVRITRAATGLTFARIPPLQDPPCPPFSK